MKPTDSIADVKEGRFPERSHLVEMEERVLKEVLAGKERRRRELALMPIEAKLRAVVRLQEMAAPILRQRGKTVRCWKLETELHM